MRVRATRAGYYNLKRRREGDEFELIEIKGFRKVGEKLEKMTISPEEQFTEAWMERMDDETDERPAREFSGLKPKKNLRDAGKEVI